MLRAARAILFVLSVLLFLAAGGLWGRSAVVWDTVNHVGAGREWGVGSAVGQVVVWWGRTGGQDLPLYWNRHFPKPDEATMRWGFGWQRFASTSSVYVPYWFLMLVALVQPALMIARRHRARRGVRLGLCGVCGYDLRASRERCPECGTAITHRSRTASTRAA